MNDNRVKPKAKPNGNRWVYFSKHQAPYPSTYKLDFSYIRIQEGTIKATKVA